VRRGRVAHPLRRRVAGRDRRHRDPALGRRVEATRACATLAVRGRLRAAAPLDRQDPHRLAAHRAVAARRLHFPPARRSRPCCASPRVGSWAPASPSR
jgi:hypothetical protein